MMLTRANEAILLVYYDDSLLLITVKNICRKSPLLDQLRTNDILRRLCELRTGVFPLPYCDMAGGGAALGFWSQNVIETLLAFKTDLHVLSE